MVSACLAWVSDIYAITYAYDVIAYSFLLRFSSSVYNCLSFSANYFLILYRCYIMSSLVIFSLVDYSMAMACLQFTMFNCLFVWSLNGFIADFFSKTMQH